MNVALAALLGLSLAQPPASDYHPFNSRSIKFPIEFAPEKVKSIRKVELHVSNDGGQVWQLAAVAPPTQSVFMYTAPTDGRYWFHIVTEDLKGTKDPANLTTEPPAMKVVFDTKQPTVAFTAAKRIGDKVVVEWRVDDQFPKDEVTRVFYRPVSAEGWQEVTLPANYKTGVSFPPGTTEPIIVRVAVADIAGNLGEGSREIAGMTATGSASTSLSPGSALPPPAGSALPPPSGVVPPDIVPPSGLAPAAPLAPPVMAPVAMPPSGPSAPAAPIPTFDPRNALTPASAGMTGPVVETVRAPVINALKFDLNYQVEQRGPSGISRVDLWVTRDDGKSWVWWSQHDGRETPVKVNLGTSSNVQPEGLYGFRLVPVSGAGLSEATPVAGDAPDIRVIVDVSAPVVKIYPAVADPTAPDALVIQWEATDKNFGDEPITLEWSEGAAGPWRAIAASAPDAASPLGSAPAAKRIANGGRYVWHVPPGLPPRVYLKVTARDAAGNATEQVTREPILIDLTKPRAKITGIGTGPLVRP